MRHRLLSPRCISAFVVTTGIICSGTACVQRSIDPNLSSSLIESVFVNEGTALYEHHDGGAAPALIFTTADGETIQSFVPAPSGNEIYLVLTRRNDETGQRESRVTLLAGDGSQAELLSHSSCIDCEGAFRFGDIHLSPDERFLALDAYLYEGSTVIIYDLERRARVDFAGGRGVDHELFLVWDPDRDALYSRAFIPLIEYDIALRTRSFLPSPNIRDYVTEKELLKQGYLGERADYESLIGVQRPQAVSWHPAGWHFTFEREGDFYLFDVADSTEELLHDFDDGTGRGFGTRYRVLWNSGGARPHDPPEYGNADLIVRIDSTSLDTLTALNDSIAYEFGMRHSLSYFLPSWNHRITELEYYFRESVSVEKIRVAEMDFFFRVFVFDLTPRFWFLLTGYEYYWLTETELAVKYSTGVEDYAGALGLLRGIRYPEILRDKKELYEELVSRDHRFERSFAEYIRDDDLAALSDSVSVLLQGEREEEIDSILAILSNPETRRAEKLVSFYKEMANRFFNYYGKVIAKDLDKLKEQLRIYEIWPGLEFLAFAPPGRDQTPRSSRRKAYERAGGN